MEFLPERINVAWHHERNNVKFKIILYDLENDIRQEFETVAGQKGFFLEYPEHSLNKPSRYKVYVIAKESGKKSVAVESEEFSWGKLEKPFHLHLFQVVNGKKDRNNNGLM